MGKRIEISTDVIENIEVCYDKRDIICILNLKNPLYLIDSLSPEYVFLLTYEEGKRLMRIMENKYGWGKIYTWDKEEEVKIDNPFYGIEI